MSTLSNKIFHDAPHKKSSPFGKRDPIVINGKKTSSFHSGTDYSTGGKKLAQYAVCEGKVVSCGMDTKGANALYVWVSYPKLGVKMLHYHLDQIKVKTGQSVNENTLLGYTGKTGNATGIHLHLGIKRLSGGDYIDPEKYSDEFEKIIMRYEKGIYTVNATTLNVRKGAGKTFDVKLYPELSDDAKKQILSLTNGRKINGYVKGMTATVYEVVQKDGYHWGRTPSGYIALEYCTRIK